MKHKIHPFLKLIFLLMLPAVLYAHPTGTTKMDLTLLPGRLEAVVDINRDDILNLVLTEEDRRKPFQKPEENCRKIADYLQSRLLIEADNTGLYPMTVKRWPGSGPDTGRYMDSAAFSTANYSINVQWALPAGASSITIASQLFAEYQGWTDAVCHISLFLEKELVIQGYIQPEDLLRLPLHPDSLAERIRLLKPPEVPQQTEIRSIPTLYALYAGIAVIVLFSGLFFLFRRKTGL